MHPGRLPAPHHATCYRCLPSRPTIANYLPNNSRAKQYWTGPVFFLDSDVQIANSTLVIRLICNYDCRACVVDDGCRA